MPKLKRVDLRKRNEHEHPDISTRKWYLAKINGEFHEGKFGRQWYGLIFEAVADSRYQFTYEGWQGLWEIQR